jgi:hypothetical protein
MIGDCHAMGVARQIFEHAAGPPKGGLTGTTRLVAPAFSHQAVKAAGSARCDSSPHMRRSSFRKARRRDRRKDFRKRLLNRRTGRKKDDLRTPIQREPSREIPPPGAMQWRCGCNHPHQYPERGRYARKGLLSVPSSPQRCSRLFATLSGATVRLLSWIQLVSD